MLVAEDAEGLPPFPKALKLEAIGTILPKLAVIGRGATCTSEPPPAGEFNRWLDSSDSTYWNAE